jgi:hypothetical protein
MSEESDLFLASFRVECTAQNPKGRLVPCERRSNPIEGWARITDYTNSQGRFYEENHLEEWVAWCPQAVFPGERVLVLASQNYAHLPEKIDLLMVNPTWRFSVVEAKSKDVAKNGGTPAYQIHMSQMRRYVAFLRQYLQPFPGRLAGYYRRFSERFYGQPRRLEEVLQREFGAGFLSGNGENRFQEVYLAHNFDDHAVDYFKSQTVTPVGSIRLVYFRFDPADAYIEFRERPLN